MKQICIICGAEAFKENLCELHFLEKNKLFEIPEKLNLKYCTNCGAYYDKKWVKNDLENIIKSKIKTKNRILRKEIDVKNNHAIVICKGYIKPSKKIKEETKRVEIKIEKRKCDNCIKLLSGYYQAVFQIRGERKEKILKYLMNLLNQGDVILEKTKEGYDIKFIDKKKASKISGLLKDFSIKKSYKLITEKKGKKLYRNSYAIR